MNETEKIAAIVSGMNFDRRKPVPSGTKENINSLYNELAEIRKKIDKLHLGLWYALEKNDFKTYDGKLAREELKAIKDGIDRLL